MAGAALGLALLLLAAPGGAGDVRQLPGEVFVVRLTDASGQPAESFSPGDEAFFNVDFALAMSGSQNYPVVVTVIVAQGTSRETTVEAYSGQLGEGLWRVTQGVKVQSGWAPQVPWKVILKTRMFFTRIEEKMIEGGTGGEEKITAPKTTSYYTYSKGEGILKVE